jgi:uncharacterized protein (DUF2062 family)
MLFRRRMQPGYLERLKLWLWPRVSWRRSALYYSKRILRLSGSPYAIAMGAGVGAAVAFTPFLGLHLVITFVVAWMLRGNLIAGAIAGSAFGNPISYPFIWAATYQIGQVLLHNERRPAPEQLGHDLLHKSWSELWPLIEPLSVGSIPLGVGAGFIVYILVHKAILAYRDGRSRRFAARRPRASAPAE